jgi:hypothetical protein
VGDQYNEVEGSAVITPLNGSPALHREEAGKAADWYRSITGKVFR